MMCLHPIRIQNPNYDPEHFSEPGNSLYMNVPCGKCEACLVSKRREWFTRLLLESELHEFSTFLTLTYNEENLPHTFSGHPTFNKKDVQDYIKRLRKAGLVFRYFLVAEYGLIGHRPHYHAVLFGLPCTATNQRILQEKWTKGFINADPCNPARMHYCCKYVLFKSDCPEGCQKPFMLCSRKPAIGTDFFVQNGLSILTAEQIILQLSEMVAPFFPQEFSAINSSQMKLARAILSPLVNMPKELQQNVYKIIIPLCRRIPIHLPVLVEEDLF